MKNEMERNDDKIIFGKYFFRKKKKSIATHLAFSTTQLIYFVFTLRKKGLQ